LSKLFSYWLNVDNAGCQAAIFKHKKPRCKMTLSEEIQLFQEMEKNGRGDRIDLARSVCADGLKSSSGFQEGEKRS